MNQNGKGTNMRRTDDTLILKMLDEGKNQKEIAAHFGVSPAAICKRVKRLLPPPESFENLTDKEQKFVLGIAGGKSQTQAVMNSFDVTSRESAKSLGTKLMAKPDIQTAVSDIMQQQGLTKTYRVKKLRQHIDHKDPNVSLKGLDQSWKLDGSYAPEKFEIDMRSIHADIETIRAMRDEQKARESKDCNKKLTDLDDPDI